MTALGRHFNGRVGWLARNRWGLGLLPLALVLALAASSDRVKTYFWDSDLHEPLVTAQGAWRPYSEPYTLDDGEHTMSLKARLDAVGPLTAQQAAGPYSYVLPSGTAAVQVELSVQADPNTPLTGCQMALRDADGNQYTYEATDVAGGQPTSSCVPADTPGPNASLGQLSEPDPDQKPRPAQYTVKPIWVIPAGVRITEVDLWWTIPKYLAFRTPQNLP